MVQRHELNLFRKPSSGRYVAVAFHQHVSDHEHRTPYPSKCDGGALGVFGGSTAPHVFDAYLLTTFIRLYDA